MDIAALDKFFPWVVFFYGFLLVVVLENPALVSAMTIRNPEAVAWLKPRRGLAWICVFVGGLWSLQNLWF